MCIESKLIRKPNQSATNLGNDARKSARSFDSKSVIEPNCRNDISYWCSGGDWMGLLCIINVWHISSKLKYLTNDYFTE